MSVITAFKSGVETLRDPHSTFSRLPGRILDEILSEYLQLLLTCSLLAGIISFVVAIARATILQILNGVTINYSRLVNYSLGIASGTFFFYLFAGTFLLFLISLLMWAILRKMRYIDLIKTICVSMTPILFFSWISGQLGIALGLWSIVLLWSGIKQFQNNAVSQRSLRDHRKHRGMK